MAFNRKAVGVAAIVALGLGITGCAGTPAGEPAERSTEQDAYFERLPEVMQTSGMLQVAFQQHPPYSVVEGSTISGPNYDMAEAIAERLGLEAEHTEVAHGLAPVLAGIQSSRYDIFMGPIQTTPERAADFDLIGWATSRTNYLVDKTVITGEDAHDLCGETVAFVDASQIGTQVEALSAWCEDEGDGAISMMPLADTNATLLAVKSGRAIAAGTTAGAAQYTLDADEAFARLPQPEEADGTRNNQGLVLPKDGELTPLVLEVLEDMYEDGSYQEIMDGYGLGDLMPDAPTLNPPHQAE